MSAVSRHRTHRAMAVPMQDAYCAVCERWTTLVGTEIQHGRCRYCGRWFRSEHHVDWRQVAANGVKVLVAALVIVEAALLWIFLLPGPVAP